MSLDSSSVIYLVHGFIYDPANSIQREKYLDPGSELSFIDKSASINVTYKSFLIDR